MAKKRGGANRSEAECAGADLSFQVEGQGAAVRSIRVSQPNYPSTD